VQGVKAIQLVGHFGARIEVLGGAN